MSVALPVGLAQGGHSCVLVLPVSISRKLGEVDARAWAEKSRPPVCLDGVL